MEEDTINENDQEMTLTYKIEGDGIEVIIVDNGTMLESVENEDNTKEEPMEWNRKTINFLLSQYKEKLSAFRNPRCKRKDIWQQIADTFSKLGYIVKTEDLDRKFRNMKKTFLTIKNKGDDKPLKWEYFEQMNELLTQEDTAIPDLTDTSAVESSEETGVYDDYIGWNKSNILLLIELYKSNMERLQNSDMKRKDFWLLMSEQFANHGYVISPEFIDRKYRNLKKTYRKIRDHPNLSEAEPPKWEYYTAMKEIDTDPPVDYDPIRFTFEDSQPERRTNQRRIIKKGNRKLNCHCSTLARRNLVELVKLRRAMQRQNVFLARNNTLLQQNNDSLGRLFAKLRPVKKEVEESLL